MEWAKKEEENSRCVRHIREKLKEYKKEVWEFSDKWKQ